MVESNRQAQVSDPYERFDEAINDPRLYPTQQYERPESRQLEPLPNDRVPLFLSDYDQQYEEEYDDPPQYTFGSKQPKSYTGRIVSGAIAVSAAAAIVGVFMMDATRSVLVDAKASLASVAPISLGGAPAETVMAAQPTVESPAPPPQRVVQQAAPEPRIAAPDVQAAYRSRPSEQLPSNVADAQASMRKASDKPTELAYATGTPSREDIAAALQSAAKRSVVASADPVAPVAPPPVAAAPKARSMDADELAALLKRAKGLLAVGDIASARLLLERAADAQEAEAALMLATTYDPLVIGNQDMRSIMPDPAMARAWYQKAAKLGSADALRRLQSQN